MCGPEPHVALLSPLLWISVALEINNENLIEISFISARFFFSKWNSTSVLLIIIKIKLYRDFFIYITKLYNIRDFLIF